MLISDAPTPAMSGQTCSRASSSKMQKGHHFPRKKWSTIGPFSSRALEPRIFPSTLNSANSGATSPTFSILSETPESLQSSICLCRVLSASGGRKDSACPLIESSCSFKLMLSLPLKIYYVCFQATGRDAIIHLD